MTVLKSIVVAFSMYSRIPMPRFNWDSKDMKYHLIFFPWVGAVIGALEYGWYYLVVNLPFNLPYDVSIDRMPFVLVAMAIPIIVTGGFHIDGFMDTSDALASLGDKEKRLEILKDSHVGAFAIIRLVTHGLILAAALYIMDLAGIIAWCFSFFATRAISGICVVNYKKAKNDGILFVSSKTASEKLVMFFLMLQFIACAVYAGGVYDWYWTISMVGLAIAVIQYIYTAYSKFGGITGDLAGWFVCKAEVYMAVCIAILSIFI
ncbi:cobalamin-5'-phosphate synthase [Pseudobutyrivibrio sp. YE44]|uniref:adenosylcobinamide-GDP ribazoletransferase n=1 Tax=Pseudobutyrivibrio sp. YE44 TaxID=1520802 RepID=UPI00088BF339|nr:adenosylcobinamide-GDP ribazoletransferase [Pseudobutyrivibrio sp. YE44]SDB05988.1 cobalamin-5'-phosphate synthase [Pseudobutyrivibrio sp. YE44]